MALNFYTEANAANGAPKPKKVQQARTTDLGRQQVGGLSVDQLSEYTDADLQTNLREGGVRALKDHFSSQNEDDAAAQGELRDFYRQSLSGLGTLGDRRGTAFDTQAQRGAQNLLGQYQRSRAGTGRIGGRGEADIMQRLTEEYTKGINDLGGQQLTDAARIQGGLEGVVNTDMRERAFQNQQAQSLANYLLGQQSADMQREGQLGSGGGGNDWMASVLPAVGGIAGTLIAPGIGTGIGASLGSAAGGAMGGGGGGGASSGMGIANLIQQQQMMDQMSRNSSGGSQYSNPAAEQERRLAAERAQNASILQGANRGRVNLSAYGGY